MRPTPSPAHSRRLPRGIAILATGALAASGIAFGALPAQAETGDVNVVDATLAWGFNNYAAFSLGEVSGNVMTDTDASPRALMLVDGQGELDASNTGVIDFAGTASYNYVYLGDAGAGAFTLSDFELSVTDGTTGALSAEVGGLSSFVTAATAGTRTTVATFDIASLDVTDGAIEIATAAPDYPVSTTYPNGSWPEAYVGLFDPSAQAFWYASGATPGSASNESKKPLSLTVSADIAVPAVGVTASYPATGGLDVTAAGTGFAALNAGVYVGVGPVGLDLGQTVDPAYAAKFLDATWIPTSAFGIGGAISATLHVDTAQLDPTTSYAVYTWNAHAHATTASDTVTPVPFTYASLADAPKTEEPGPTPTETVVAPTATTLAAASVVYGHSTALTANVTAGATGTVQFFSNGAALGSAPVVNGSAAVATSSSLKAGNYSITAQYSGDATHAASSAASTLKVAKAAPKVTVSGKKFAKASKPKVKVSVAKFANGVKVSGKVAVYVNGTKVKTVKVTTKKSVVTVKLPKKYSKAITVKAKLLGSANAKVVTSKKITVRVKH